MNSKDITLSKALSRLLRHKAVQEGLSISSEGYVEVTSILQHKQFRGKYSRGDIERVVDGNNKQRFKLRVNTQTNQLEIKAHQGHSIFVGEAGLIPVTEVSKYKSVVHGTYLKCWPQIRQQGLSRMKRQHIHLAKGTLDDTSVVSGLRANVEVYIFVDLKKALEDGLEFFESENGVILTRGDEHGFLLPKYFLKAVKVHSGK